MERIDTLEQQLTQVIAVQEQNANAISAQVNALDQLRTDVNSRLNTMENQLAALVRSNQLLAELITTRLPPTNE